MTDTAEIPIPVYLAMPTRDTPGNAVRWKAGQQARFLGENGEKRVTIITGSPVAHDAVPGVMCMEVMLDGEAACVRASSLRLP